MLAMYIPDHFAEQRLEQLHRIIHDNPLGIVVMPGDSGMDADHLLFDFEPHDGTHGRLMSAIVHLRERGETALAQIMLENLGPLDPEAAPWSLS